MKTALILGITSDIGRELALRLRAEGWSVAGTYRDGSKPDNAIAREWMLVHCDFATAESVDGAAVLLREKHLRWDLAIVAVGTEEPIGPFFENDPAAWERGVTVNALGPLRLLRAVHGLRKASAPPAVAFFSGSGTNSAAPTYSAYSASKILLIKMCELLDAESPDTSFFIIGPGIVRTKIHQQTLDAPKLSGKNFDKVVEFLGSTNPGTSHADIHDCLMWCVAQGKAVVGGRNIALAHDSWRDGGASLSAALRDDLDLYKLRRHGNPMKLPRPSP